MKKILLPIFIALVLVGCGGGGNTSNTNKEFCIDMNNYQCSKTITLTSKKIVNNVRTKFGNKKLVIWISEDEYNNNDITDDMLNELADKFLKNGDGNDIYDWDTNVHGKEWGSDAQNIDKDVIPNTNTIDIALYDMHNSSVAGYFWAKDMFTKSAVPASNERVMIYVNSKMYRANKEEVFTTLAHEFTHLINFYHRDIKLGLNDSVWFKEFLAETTENLVASKLHYKVQRYEAYNEENYDSITSWQNSVSDYASVHVLGAFLLRNYGGAKLLHDISLNKNSDVLAIEDAVGLDFSSILDNLSIAYINSNLRESYKYNIQKVSASAEHSFLIDQEGVVVKKIMNSGNTKIHLNLQSQKNVYISILNNSDKTQNISINGQNQRKVIKKNSLKSYKKNNDIMEKVSHFNNISVKSLLNLKENKNNKIIFRGKRITSSETTPKFNYIDTIHSKYNNITYDLDSVNFYNYESKPTFYVGGNLDNDSILYYQVGKNLIGDVDIDIDIEKGADVEIITQ